MADRTTRRPPIMPLAILRSRPAQCRIRASKAALNQLIKTASIEMRRTHKHLICVALHPGTVATPFTKDYPQHKSVPPDAAAENLLGVIEKLTPEDNGRFFDWAGKPVPW